MQVSKFSFEYEVFTDISKLDVADAELLSLARKVTNEAYAPYSKFHVGAAARLTNGQIVKGTNQENAAYPVGICAERVLLGVAATLYPDVGIQTIAVSYKSGTDQNDHPISPCGMCRQALLEFEKRTATHLRVILGGQSGEVYIISRAIHLLPFAFTSDELA